MEEEKYIKRHPLLIERKLEPDIPNPYGFIYITTNLVNGKKYLGQHYLNSNKKYLGSGKILQIAIKKYGKENFVLEPIDWASSKEELNEKEKFWISFFKSTEEKSWYNIAQGGTGGITWKGEHPCLRVKQTEEHKRHISLSLKKISYWSHHKVTEETKCKISRNHADFTGEKNPFYNRTHTEDTKEKIRRHHIGKVMSQETRDKHSKRNRGRKWIHSDVEEKFIPPHELETYLDKGWSKGRLPSNIAHLKNLGGIK